MRVVIATDSIGTLSSAEAGAVLARGWPSAETNVTALGESGAAFGDACGATLGVEPQLGVAEGLLTSILDTAERLVIGAERNSPEPVRASALDLDASSAALGDVLRAALGPSDQPSRAQPAEIVLDLSANLAHDGGAGLLAALGATADIDLRAGAADLSGLRRLDLEPVRTLLAGRRLIGVVGADQLDLPLLGLRGITSRRGREVGLDAEVMLRTDATLEKLAELADPAAANRPGAGACGGLGFVVLALGGQLVSGPAYCARLGELDERLRGADLAVTGCTVYDFARRGGGIVAEIAQRSAAALVPCVVLAGEVLLGAREMRTMGVEAAYAVRDSGSGTPSSIPKNIPENVGAVAVDAAELLGLAARVARSWSW